MSHDHEQTITPQEALRIIRTRLAKGSKKGRQLNEDTKVQLTARMLALEGLCGKCSQVKPEEVQDSRGSSVSVRCKAGESPMSLYYGRAVNLLERLEGDPKCPGKP